MKFPGERTASLLAALITAASYTVFVASLLGTREGDVSRFVVAGGSGVDAQRVPAGLTVRPGGYDGGALYRLALDPFTRVPTAYGITLDNPPYRHQRIGYPFIVWLLSLGGQPGLVPMLVIVNVAALGIMAVLGSLLSRQAGHSGLWGLAFPFFPGFLWSLSRDLSEITACCWALAGILAVVRRRSGAAAFLLSAAVLTRETSLVIALAIGLVYVWKRLRRRENQVGAIAVIAPFAIYIGQQLLLGALWGSSALTSAAQGFAWPFSEFGKALAFAWPRRIQLQRLYFVECISS